MKIAIYHIDAFTDKVFSGNPAAVCVLISGKAVLYMRGEIIIEHK